MARLAYAAESWALIALGALHMAATPQYHEALTTEALWFFSGGLVMVLAAVLNLLNRTYGAGAPGLRLASITTNLVIAAFAITAGAVGRAGPGQWIVVLAIVVPLTGLSLSRRALGGGTQSGAA